MFILAIFEFVNVDSLVGNNKEFVRMIQQKHFSFINYTRKNKKINNKNNKKSFLFIMYFSIEISCIWDHVPSLVFIFACIINIMTFLYGFRFK